MRECAHWQRAPYGVEPVVKIGGQRAADATAGIIRRDTEGRIGIAALGAIGGTWQAVIHFGKRQQRKFDLVELLLQIAGFGAARILREFAQHDAAEHREDNENHADFDQGKGSFGGGLRGK